MGKPIDTEHNRRAWLFTPTLFRPVLTWRVGTPKDPTCSHTICSGTIPLLSLLLAPFTQCSTALDQSATASLAASLGNRLASWFSKVLISYSLPLSYPPLSSVLRACCLSFLSPPPFPPSRLSFLLICSLILPLLLLLFIPCPVSLSLSLRSLQSRLFLWTTEYLI